MTTRPVRIDPPGKWLGIIVFAVGIGLLLSVFVFAYRDLVASGDPAGVSRLASDPAALIFKGVLLFVMGFVASAIANKGIALYQAARVAATDDPA